MGRVSSAATGGRGADYFIFDNEGETGTDQILDFGNPDRLLTTVQLEDGGDGLVDLTGGTLDLFGSSEVGADQLRFDGTVMIDGTTYYSYALANEPQGGAAALDFPLRHDIHHFDLI